MSGAHDSKGQDQSASSLPPFLTRREYPGPGPEERKFSSRLHFKLFRRWPASVVTERLAVADRMMIEARREMDAWMKERWLNGR
jgi:hypothetical protein